MFEAKAAPRGAAGAFRLPLSPGIPDEGLTTFGGRFREIRWNRSSSTGQALSQIERQSVVNGLRVAFLPIANRREGTGTPLRTLIRLLKDGRGLTTIEYGLLAVFIAAGLIVAFGLLGDNLSETYEDLNREIQSRL